MDHFLYHQHQFKPNPLSSWSSDILHIQGGCSLHGEVLLGGAKNAALPIIIAAILGIKETVLQNVPTIQDVQNLVKIMETLGVEVNWQPVQHQVTLKTDQMQATPLTHPLMQSMRASFLLAGPMLARFGHVTLLFPGGDAIGTRPVNYHLQGFQQLGAIVDVQQSNITMTAKNGLKGAIIHLPFPSVGATQNLMMAACCARGETVILQAAQEPEIVDLANFLNAMGGLIQGAGSDTLYIRGSAGELLPYAVSYRIMPDRIELITLAAAAAMTGGKIFIPDISASILGAGTLNALGQLGVVLHNVSQGIYVQSCPVNQGDRYFSTAPFPGLATDAQPIIMALACLVEGETRITEAIFENRFQHARALQAMGADINVEKSMAFIRGKSSLSGTCLHATDIRAAAALLIAALAARGTSTLCPMHHIYRGYDGLIAKLTSIGACLAPVPFQAKS